MPRHPNLQSLLDSDDTTTAIIELDNFIGEMSDYGEAMERLTPGQRSFYLNQSLEREVNNGGFDQFFFNSSGNFAHETVDSLEAIGAKKTADLLREAIDAFPESRVPKDREERGNLMLDEVSPESDRWHELDQRFYAYDEPLTDLNLAFIRANVDEF
jgi:hypothetical protein